MSPSKRRKFRAWLVVLLFSSIPAAAHAQDAQAVAAAQTLKQQGDTKMDEQSYADAYALYVRAYGVTADPALLYNQSRALEAMGQYPEALSQLEQFAKVAPADLKAKVPLLDELFADLRGRVSTLIVHCSVKGARIVVRQTNVGACDGTTKILVRAGHADVEVLAEGFEPFRIESNLPGGGAIEIRAALKARADTGSVAVRAFPEGALVSIDDNPVGMAPIETKVHPGEHTVVVTKDGYRPERIPFAVAAGERREMTARLSATSTSVFGKWWFWATAGAVAVTGALVTVAVLTERSPESGTFSPGNVKSPLMIRFGGL